MMRARERGVIQWICPLLHAGINIFMPCEVRKGGGGGGCNGDILACLVYTYRINKKKIKNQKLMKLNIIFKPWWMTKSFFYILIFMPPVRYARGAGVGGGEGLMQ